MLRTQMMIPVELKTKLEKSAKRRGVSMAELIRRFAEEKLKEEKERGNPVELLLEYAKKAKKGKMKNDKINSENFRQNWDVVRDWSK